MFQQIMDKLSDWTGVTYFIDPLEYASCKGEKTLPISGYRQLDSYSCGFVAGLMVLHLFQPNADGEEFYQDVEGDEDGTTTAQLRRALKQWGVRTSHRQRLNRRSIVSCIDNGNPVIIGVKKPPSDHWVVIYGYGPDYLFMAGDGLPWMSKKISMRRFMHYWSPRGSGIVCSRERAV